MLHCSKQVPIGTTGGISSNVPAGKLVKTRF